MKILVINGVNLNMLGRRDPKIYGVETLDNINDELARYFRIIGVGLEFYQSNIEGEIVTKIQNTKCDALVINAGAYSHYSIAIADALEILNIPKIEVHMSNIFAREQFRHESTLTRVCNGLICGFGADVYHLAVDEAAILVKRRERQMQAAAKGEESKK